VNSGEPGPESGVGAQLICDAGNGP